MSFPRALDDVLYTENHPYLLYQINSRLCGSTEVQSFVLAFKILSMSLHQCRACTRKRADSYFSGTNFSKYRIKTVSCSNLKI